jgi:ABC-type branched-subunit amino acid transport system substrate-binding protein
VNRVYASLPLSGPAAVPGRDVLLGAQLALESRSAETELVALDGYGLDREERALANAGRAGEDPACLAYIGDFHSSQVEAVAPLLGEANLLQIAPVATFVGLGGETLVRLMPNDSAGASAIASWLRAAGIRSLLVVHDDGADYGEPVAPCARRRLPGRDSKPRSVLFGTTRRLVRTSAPPRQSSTRELAGRALARSGTRCKSSIRVSGS